MGKVRAQAIMSLDGYVAKRGQDIGSLFDWAAQRRDRDADPYGRATNDSRIHHDFFLGRRIRLRPRRPSRP